MSINFKIANDCICDSDDDEASLSNFLPLSGGDMTGQINTITPVDASNAANKAYVDSVVISGGGGAFLPLDGSLPMNGDLNLGGNQLNNVGNPTLASDATNKNYVDTNFVDLTTNQTIAGEKTFSNDTQFADFIYFGDDKLGTRLAYNRDVNGTAIDFFVFSNGNNNGDISLRPSNGTENSLILSSTVHNLYNSAGNISISHTTSNGNLEIEGATTLNGGLAIHAGSNGDFDSIPPVSTTTQNEFEIRSHTQGSNASDHGLLRLRGGGGTSTSTASYIDIYGFTNQDVTRSNIFLNAPRIITSNCERHVINGNGSSSSSVLGNLSAFNNNQGVSIGFNTTDGVGYVQGLNEGVGPIGLDLNTGLRLAADGGLDADWDINTTSSAVRVLTNEPVLNRHVANKEYVDTQISTIGSGSGGNTLVSTSNLTSGTSITVPVNVNYARVSMRGGAGGGGNGGNGSAGPGGAAGGGGGSGFDSEETTYTFPVVPGETINYTIGLGGASETVGTDTTLTYTSPDGEIRLISYGGNPGLRGGNAVVRDGGVGGSGFAGGGGGGMGAINSGSNPADRGLSGMGGNSKIFIGSVTDPNTNVEYGGGGGGGTLETPALVSVEGTGHPGGNEFGGSGGGAAPIFLGFTAQYGSALPGTGGGRGGSGSVMSSTTTEAGGGGGGGAGGRYGGGGGGGGAGAANGTPINQGPGDGGPSIFGTAGTTPPGGVVAGLTGGTGGQGADGLLNIEWLNVTNVSLITKEQLKGSEFSYYSLTSPDYTTTANAGVIAFDAYERPPGQEVFISNGLYDINNGTYQIPQTGIYQFSAIVQYISTDSFGRLRLLRDDGVASNLLLSSTQFDNAASPGVEGQMDFTGKFNAGDRISMRVVNLSSVITLAEGSPASWFNGRLISTV